MFHRFISTTSTYQFQRPPVRATIAKLPTENKTVESASRTIHSSPSYCLYLKLINKRLGWITLYTSSTCSTSKRWVLPCLVQREHECWVQQAFRQLPQLAAFVVLTLLPMENRVTKRQVNIPVMPFHERATTAQY